MTIIDDGVQGAKRQSTKPNPMPIVIDIVENRSKGLDPYSAKLCREFRSRVETDVNSEDLVDVIWEYYWVNAVHRCTKEQPTLPTLEQRNASKTARAAAAARVRAEVEAKVDAKAKRMYLQMIMPNGEQLQECTREQLIKMKPELGSTIDFLIKILKRGQRPSALFKTNAELLAAAKKK